MGSMPVVHDQRAADSEAALVSGWLAGDDSAREDAYRWLWPRLVVLLDGFGHCRSDAEDLACEAWQRIEEALPTFDRGKPLWPWGPSKELGQCQPVPDQRIRFHLTGHSTSVRQ